MYVDPDEFLGDAVFDIVILGEEAPLRNCERCNIDSRLVIDCPSMTLYDARCFPGEDPNRDLILCPDCAQEHLELMNDQWAGYHSALL